MSWLRPGVEITYDDKLTLIRNFLAELVRGEKVYLISPHWQLTDDLRGMIADALKRGIELRCLMGEGEELIPEDQSFIEDEQLNMRSLHQLHAKLYWSPRHTLLTSINLLDYSGRKTGEIAIMVQDKAYLKELETLADTWWEKSNQPCGARQTQST